MSGPVDGAFTLDDYLGVDEKTHPARIDAREFTRLDNARFARGGILERRGGTAPWSYATFGDGEILGLARLNLGDGNRMTIVAGDLVVHDSTTVGALFQDGNDEAILLPVDGFHPSLSVEVTNGSAVVTLTGGAAGGPPWFTGDGGPEAGWLFYLSASDGTPADGAEIYRIASIDSDTQITLTTDYAGTSLTGQKFRCCRNLAPSLKWEFAQAGRVLVACNGYDTPVAIGADYGEPFTLGVKRPTSVHTTAAVDTGSSVNGGDGLYNNTLHGGAPAANLYFRYRVQFMTDDSLRSGPYPPIDENGIEVEYTTTDDSNGYGIRINWSAAHPRHDRAIIWRTQDIAAADVNGSIYYRIATLDVTDETYLDGHYDEELDGLETEIWTSENIEVPAASVAAYWEGRLFLGGSPDYPCGVWYSDDRIGDEIGSDSWVLLAGDRVTQFAPLSRRLIAFTSTRVHEIVPYGGTGYLSSILEEGAGCLAPQSVRQLEGAVLFFGRDGVRVFDGTRSRLLSEPVQAQMDDIPEGSKHLPAAFVHKGVYHLAIPTELTADHNSRVVAYDVLRGAWTVWRNEDADGNATLYPLAWIVLDGHGDENEVVFASNRSAQLLEFNHDVQGDVVQGALFDPAVTPERSNPGLVLATKLLDAEPTLRDRVFTTLHLQVDTDSSVTVEVIVDDDADRRFSTMVTPTTSASSWNESLWNFFEYRGTVNVIGTTIGSDPVGVVVGVEMNLVTAGVLVGDTFTMDQGTTKYTVIQLGVPGNSEAVVIGDYTGGNLSGVDYWFYRYEEGEGADTGLWWREGASENRNIVLDLNFADLVGRRAEIRLSENGEGSRFRLISMSLEYRVKTAVPKGDEVAESYTAG